MPKTTKKLEIAKFARLAITSQFPSNITSKVKIMLKNPSPKGNRKIYANFLLTQNNRKKEIGLNGQNAKTLLTLIKARKGLGTYEGIDSGLGRLSGYVCVLRHEFGINIKTIREGERRIGRYFLMDQVEVGKIYGMQGGQNDS